MGHASYEYEVNSGRILKKFIRTFKGGLGIGLRVQEA